MLGLAANIAGNLFARATLLPKRVTPKLAARPYGNDKSFTAYFMNNIATRQRIVVAVVRKEDECGLACGCPCRGRCTRKAIEKVLAWFGTQLVALLFRRFLAQDNVDA